jgi:hypothetical protein
MPRVLVFSRIAKDLNNFQRREEKKRKGWGDIFRPGKMFHGVRVAKHFVF